jgi:hypothetical protein
MRPTRSQLALSLRRRIESTLGLGGLLLTSAERTALANCVSISLSTSTAVRSAAVLTILVTILIPILVSVLVSTSVAAISAAALVTIRVSTSGGAFGSKAITTATVFVVRVSAIVSTAAADAVWHAPFTIASSAITTTTITTTLRTTIEAVAVISVGMAGAVVAAVVAVVLAMVLPVVLIVLITVRVVRLRVIAKAANLAVLVLGARLVLLVGAVGRAVGVVRQALLGARLLVRAAGFGAHLMGTVLVALLVLLLIFAVVAFKGAALVLVQLLGRICGVGVQ